MAIKPGDTFGRWKILSRNGYRKNGSGLIGCWRCRCECGTVKTVVASTLLRGESQSCGCLRSELTRARCYVDLTGQVFGRLVVREPGKRPRHWLCDCECGNTKSVFAGSLTSGDTISCGCRRQQVNRERLTKHGHNLKGARSREYSIWRAMLARCYLPSNDNYRRYGGRGIRVCRLWRQSFSAFLADVGSCPGSGWSIERINNDGDYKPGNVRWATRLEQARNRRNNRRIRLGRKTLCLSAWADETDIPATLIAYRLRRGWSVRDALSVPAGQRRSTRNT